MPPTEPTREEIEAAILQAANTMHENNEASMHTDQHQQTRTYYAGFNLTELAKRTAAALTSRPAPFEPKSTAMRLYRAINGLDGDDADQRAEFFITSTIDGWIPKEARAQVKLALAQNFEELYSRQPASLDYKLPCDVHLPPHTYISKGCDLETLFVAIRAREAFSEAATKFNHPAPAAEVVGELSLAWKKINALGGTTTEYDDFGKGINHAVERALFIIEELGGSDPLTKKAEPPSAEVVGEREKAAINLLQQILEYSNPGPEQARRLLELNSYLAESFWYQRANEVVRSIGFAAPSPDEGRVPEGWQLVPKEATREMLDEADDIWRDHHRPYYGDAYKAMLAAAPQPNAKEEE